MDRKYIGAGLFLAAAVILCIFLVYPKYQQVRAASAVAVEKENENKTQNELITAVNEANDKYKKIDRELAILKDLLPVRDEQSIAKLFIEFEDLSSQSSLSVQTLSFGAVNASAKEGAAPAGKGYNIINAAISAVGRYEDIKKFADAVRLNKHLMDVLSVEVAAGSDVANPLTSTGAASQDANANDRVDLFSFRFSINAYYQ